MLPRGLRENDREKLSRNTLKKEIFKSSEINISIKKINRKLWVNDNIYQLMNEHRKYSNASDD